MDLHFLKAQLCDISDNPLWLKLNFSLLLQILLLDGPEMIMGNLLFTHNHHCRVISKYFYPSFALKYYLVVLKLLFPFNFAFYFIFHWIGKCGITLTMAEFNSKPH